MIKIDIITKMETNDIKTRMDGTPTWEQEIEGGWEGVASSIFHPGCMINSV